MKKIHNDYWNYDRTIYELNDFKVGDSVLVKSRSRSSGTRLPLYLDGSLLVVEKVCRKNIKLRSDSYPGESWYADPIEIEPVERATT